MFLWNRVFVLQQSGHIYLGAKNADSVEHYWFHMTGESDIVRPAGSLASFCEIAFLSCNKVAIFTWDEKNADFVGQYCQYPIPENCTLFDGRRGNTRQQPPLFFPSSKQTTNDKGQTTNPALLSVTVDLVFQ